MEAKIEETNEESQLKEAANQKISFEKVATLSMAVLNFVQGTKKQYWDHANIVAGLVDGVVPEEMERFLTKSADSLRKELTLKPDGVPTDLVRTMIVIPAEPGEASQARVMRVIEEMGKLGYKIFVYPEGKVHIVDRINDQSPGYKYFGIKFVRDDDPAIYSLQLVQPNVFRVKAGFDVDVVTGECTVTHGEDVHLHYVQMKDLQDVVENDRLWAIKDNYEPVGGITLNVESLIEDDSKTVALGMRSGSISTAAIRGDGQLVVDRYDSDDDSDRLFGNDVTSLVIVSTDNKLKVLSCLMEMRENEPYPGDDDERLLALIRDRFESYYQFKKWLEANNIPFERKFDPWA